ncbi:MULTISPECIES: sensor histidine kinase [unclassified Sphingomonas]|uniref:sensor histidine kinase n=1 Tax=unclassified Sphingomonas TaxID=196159 RepID=UPI001D0F72E2|nr:MULTISPECIES: histidine kinase [unclassified Sphingomonas]MCC2978750.1 histidine kinase [Sphingomonas sp. IC4-52]MCD2315963.1 histidine kinase [Sphingomonas sp. IC-11]
MATTLPGPASTTAPIRPSNLAVRPFFEDKARAFWVLQAAGWTGYLVLRTVSSISNGFTLQGVISTIVETIVGYCITLLLSVLYGFYRGLPRITAIVLTVLTLGAATFVYALLDTFSFSFIKLSAPGVDVKLLIGALFLNFTVLAGWSALYFGINFYLIVEEQIDQLQHLETQASSAQLAMLRYQLNPHFLFNTLNSISTLVLLKQTERANAMLSRLSSFLRYTLVNEPTAHVTLAQEVETLKLYLEIEKMRFEDRLRPKFEIDPAAERARLPSLLLQPLVENAIKYAVTPKEEGAEICVTARLNGDRVRIGVSDTGPGLQPTKNKPSLSTGVGIANIRERLQQSFGTDHRFELRAMPTGGFGVEIEIPFQVE